MCDMKASVLVFSNEIRASANTEMHVLIVANSGREYAIKWKITDYRWEVIYLVSVSSRMPLEELESLPYFVHFAPTIGYWITLDPFYFITVMRV